MKPARADAVTKVKLNACLKWALVTRHSQSVCFSFCLNFFRDQLLIFYFCPIMLPVSAFVL